MKRFLLIVFVLFLVGCSEKEGLPVDVSQPGKESFDVQFLFEKDGVRIYRFHDDGRFRYFAIGNGTFLPQAQVSTTRAGNATITTEWLDGAVSGQ